MKTLRLLLLMVIWFPLPGNSQTKNSEKENGAEKIEAYYFHNAVRCETCRTVEAEAKADLKELYGNNVTFQAMNLEDKATKKIAEKLEVSGQTLLVVKGDKKINLTNEGFLYAVTNPEKFKSIIKEKVDPLMD
jgi:thiol-disulfide isomerase/thioredoxin